MPHSPPFASLGRALVGRSTRRGFLVGGATLAAACATPRRGDQRGARVVIVGAGAAGLAAAHRLHASGIAADVYDAAQRTGGRVWTAKDVAAPGITTEIGGEFIDSDHARVLDLCKRFELPLLDVEADGEKDLADRYFFGGHAYGDDDVDAAVAGIAARVDADIAKVGLDVDYAHPGAGIELDRTSLADYFAALGVDGWFAKMLEVAFVTEFGLDLGDQSALNFLNIYKDGSLWGESDERFKIAGGNQRLVDALAQRIPRPAQLGHRLVRVVERGAGYRVTFDRSGAAVDVDADVVLLTLPFSTLRDVELRFDMPGPKKTCIAELGYGTNAKVFTGVVDRRWRQQGLSGNVLSDEGFQLAWDSSRMQAGTAGGLSMFVGGKVGLEVDDGADALVARWFPGAARALGGVESNGKHGTAPWPRIDGARGSYACYRPGQWTTIAGAEGFPVGKVFFAGEHTSRAYQGFIEGAVRTGEEAADAIARLVAG